MGTGFSAGDRDILLKAFALLRQKRCPFENAPLIRNRFSNLHRDVKPQWLQPALVIEVEFRQRTADGLRHASFRGIRFDETARTVR